MSKVSKYKTLICLKRPKLINDRYRACFGIIMQIGHGISNWSNKWKSENFINFFLITFEKSHSSHSTMLLLKLGKIFWILRNFGTFLKPKRLALFASRDIGYEYSKLPWWWNAKWFQLKCVTAWTSWVSESCRLSSVYPLPSTWQRAWLFYIIIERLATMVASIVYWTQPCSNLRGHS